MNPNVIFVVAIIALANAAILPIEEVQATISHRQRRSDPPRFFGGGGANSQSQHGNFGVQYPNGAGGQLSYGHARGYGHDVSVDAMVPVWSRKSRYGESTLNVGGGVSQHFGGFSGNRMTDKRVGLNFVHRF